MSDAQRVEGDRATALVAALRLRQLALVEAELAAHGGGDGVRAHIVLAQRQATLDGAFARFPERFGGRPPLVKPLPPAVWVNPPKISPKEFALHVADTH